MQRQRKERVVAALTSTEKTALCELARVGGDVTLSAVVRALIRREAQRRGLWPVADGQGDWGEHWRRVLSEPEVGDGEQ